ncbi:MAG: hypothetical protein IJZ23_04295 [Roseburia sp.]|nr:hypothetical protein [Roseburia sp.]
MRKMNAKRGLAAALALSMGIGLTACGGTETVSSDVKYYRANYQEDLPDTFVNLNGTPILNGDTVYYAANSEDYTKYGIYSYNLTTKEEKTYFTKEESQEYDPLAGGMYVDQYTVDEEGNIYMYMQTWEVDASQMQDWSNATLDDVLNYMVENWGFNDTDAALVDWNEYYVAGYSEQEGYTDEEGNIDYSKVMTEWSSWNIPRTYTYEVKKMDVSGNEVYTMPVETETEDMYSYVIDMVAGADGILYMYMNQYSNDGMQDEYFVVAFDANGKQTGKCKMDNYGNGLVALADGRVGALAWNTDYTGYLINVIDPQTMQVAEEISLGESYVENLKPLDEENYLITEGGALYKFNLTTQEKELYFNWVDANITSNSVRGYQMLEDGRILVATQTYDYTTYESLEEIAIIEEIPAEEAANIKSVTLACIYTDEQLEQKVININKKNPETRIRIKQFYQDYSDMDYEDAMASFMTAMASDPEVDIVFFNGATPYADMMNFASKGLLIDLNTFLDADEEIKREDLMGSVLDACTYNDMLVGLPTGFSVRTVIGKVSDVGTEPGWTFAEMKALLESKEPGTQLFYGRTRDWALQMCLNLGYKQFIDMENVNCNFNSQEFIDVLEFANLFPEEYEWVEGEDETVLMNTGKVLLADYSISDFAQIQLYSAIFGDELTYIGYPTTEGNGALMSLGSSFGITKNCEQTDVAWKLIREYFLPKEEDNGYYNSWNFSIRQEEFDKFCENAMSEENGGGSWGWGDFQVEIKPATQEQVDEVKDLIANITAVDGAVSNDIMNIINEEAAGYFSGDKTAEQVAETIQSRVWVYLSETN